MSNEPTPTVPATIKVYPAHVRDEVEWEIRALAVLRRLRSDRKRAILELTEQGVILVYVLTPAGRIE